MSRVVVVTGSAGDIGREIVAAFQELGDIVEGFDLADGFDVTDPVACRVAIDDLVMRRGRIDVLCNNAGTGSAGDVVVASPEEWHRVFAVNVFGAAYMAAAALPHMKSQRDGVIINTCSIVATVGLEERVVYAASKGALRSMTRAIAADGLRHSVRVNCVSPATVDGAWVSRNAEAAEDPEVFMNAMRNRQPTGEFISASAVARAIVLLADPRISLTGVDLPVDGGVTSLRSTT